MLDIKFIRENLAKVKKAVQDKNIVLDVDKLLLLHKEWSTEQRKLQDLQKQKNQNALQFKNQNPSTLTPIEKQTLIQAGRVISQKISAQQAILRQKQSLLDNAMQMVPNIPSPDSPIGKDASKNKIIKTVGAKPKKPYLTHHVDLLIQNDWADFQRVAKVSGSRSYGLKNEMVFLEQALIQWGLNFLAQKGFQLFSLPNLADRLSFKASGHFPEGEEQVYYIEKDNTYLTGTAEVILHSLYRDEILPAHRLPLTLAGLSPCFRREAGSAGKDVRGLLRVHQFVKLEQYVICENSLQQTEKYHNFLLQNAEEILQALELPYQVLLICTGDMGAGKYKMHDIECWLPSLGKYVETHSCSSLLAWQARRARLRYRDKEGKIHYCHTLNNTALASPRLLAVFLENHQTEDGSLYIPPVLRPYLNGADKLKKA